MVFVGPSTDGIGRRTDMSPLRVRLERRMAGADSVGPDELDANHRAVGVLVHPADAAVLDRALARAQLDHEGDQRADEERPIDGDPMGGEANDGDPNPCYFARSSTAAG